MSPKTFYGVLRCSHNFSTTTLQEVEKKDNPEILNEYLHLQSLHKNLFNSRQMALELIKSILRFCTRNTRIFRKIYVEYKKFPNKKFMVLKGSFFKLLYRHFLRREGSSSFEILHTTPFYYRFG